MGELLVGILVFVAGIIVGIRWAYHDIEWAERKYNELEAASPSHNNKEGK